MSLNSVELINPSLNEEEKNYYEKYIKYKIKYIQLQKQFGGLFWKKPHDEIIKRTQHLLTNEINEKSIPNLMAYIEFMKGQKELLTSLEQDIKERIINDIKEIIKKIEESRKRKPMAVRREVLALVDIYTSIEEGARSDQDTPPGNGSGKS